MLARNEEEDAWVKVEKAISNIPQGFSPYLHHLGKHYLVLQRKDDSTGVPMMKVSQFSGSSETSKFNSILHLHPSMIHHHMPWSYNKLFKGYSYD